MITSVSVIPQDTGVSLSSSCFPWRQRRKMNKAEMQKSVATLETEAASCMAWERRANILLSIRSPKFLHSHRKAVAANTENIFWGLWGHPGCCCWQVAAPESCSAIKTEAEHPLCLFPLKGGIEEWGVPNDGTSRALGIHRPLLSAWCSPLPCRDAGLAWVGSVGAPGSHPGQTDPECCCWLQRGLAAASPQLSRLAALALMALLPGKVKYMVGQ